MVQVNTAKQMSREEALNKVDMLHRLVKEYDWRAGPAIKEILENKFKGMVARD